ncbi:MAG: HNH endonuclease [Deltaproteobacteria bacterium]|nr:HNH endonuclease [Deltaproteobacteria bacterium]
MLREQPEGQRSLSGRIATRDHKWPLSRGGRHHGNIVLACGSCNQKKGDMTASEFIATCAKWLAVKRHSDHRSRFVVNKPTSPFVTARRSEDAGHTHESPAPVRRAGPVTTKLRTGFMGLARPTTVSGSQFRCDAAGWRCPFRWKLENYAGLVTMVNQPSLLRRL